MPQHGGRPSTTELLPGLSLRTALALVMAVWVTCTLVMFHKHSFVAVSRFNYQDHVLSSLPLHPLKVNHLAQIQTNGAQAAAVVPIEDSPRYPYALVLVANYFGSSALYLFRPRHKAPVKPLAILQTECAHSWASWQQAGRRWAAVANYCTKEKQKAVVVYELEQLATSTPQEPDWGFKAAAALTAQGPSHVLHLTLPPPTPVPQSTAGGAGAASASAGGARPQHALAFADYTNGEIVLYTLSYEGRQEASGQGRSQGKGQQKGRGHQGQEAERGTLVASEVQRIQLPGVSALATCRYPGGGGEGEGGAGDLDEPQLFLVGLSYFAQGSYATHSAVYRWDQSTRRFEQLQMFATHGAHGARCFTLSDPPVTASPSPSTSSSSSSSSSSSAAAAGTRRRAITAGTADSSRAIASTDASDEKHQARSPALFLAIANSREDSTFVTNSTIWRYDPLVSTFLLTQRVTTVGAHDVAHVRLPLPPPKKTAGDPLLTARKALGLAVQGEGSGGGHPRHGSRVMRTGFHGRMGGGPGGGGGGGSRAEETVDVLVFANRGPEQVCSPSEQSPILAWDAELQRFEPAGQLSGLQCATGLAADTLVGATVLLATGDRTPNGSYVGPLTHVWRLEAEGGGHIRRRKLETAAAAAAAGALHGRRRARRRA